jgi:hypothetical protein
MAKETPGAKRLKEEERLKNLSGSRTFGERSKLGWHSTLFGKDKSGYGTSLSKGAASAGNKAAKEDVAKQLKTNPYKTVGETSKSADVARRKAEREAASEERREARGMKKGGFIKDAIKKPGALRKSLGVKKGEKIPASKLAKAAKAPGKMGQRARLAQTLKKMK